MASRDTKASRPRGRPPNADGQATAQRLIESAARVCAEYGFDGCTLTRIADGADVHPTAVYNHFEGRDDLLYAVARRALEQLTEVASSTPGGSGSFQDIAATYLQPDMREQRSVLAEIHVASRRHDELAALLAGWHRTWTETMVASLASSDDDPRATVQALFLLLLGLCHVDELEAVDADRAAVTRRITTLVDDLVPTTPRSD